MRSRALTTLLFLVSAFAAPVTPPVTPKEALQAIQARMDKAASEFKTMTANVTNLTHTDVINENSIESGTVTMKKVAAGEVQGLINFVNPDKRTVAFEKRRLRIYYPKLKTVQEWDLGKHGEQLDQFLMIGFGTSGTSLAKDYDMTVLPTETLKNPEAVQTIRLRLVPKTGEARDYVKQLELWIPETGDPYPIREKISAPSGDYRQVTYTNLRTNIPLPPDALQLRTPDGVVTEHPGK
jgi:outer membrane lipoprotein-sorting protein